jgi:hypothetical protein
MASIRSLGRQHMHQVRLEGKSQEIHIEVGKIQQISQLQTLQPIYYI